MEYLVQGISSKGFMNVINNNSDKLNTDTKLSYGCKTPLSIKRAINKQIGDKVSYKTQGSFSNISNTPLDGIAQIYNKNLAEENKDTIRNNGKYLVQLNSNPEYFVDTEVDKLEDDNYQPFELFCYIIPSNNPEDINENYEYEIYFNKYGFTLTDYKTGSEYIYITDKSAHLYTQEIQDTFPRNVWVNTETSEEFDSLFDKNQIIRVRSKNEYTSSDYLDLFKLVEETPHQENDIDLLYFSFDPLHPEQNMTSVNNWYLSKSNFANVSIGDKVGSIKFETQDLTTDVEFITDSDIEDTFRLDNKKVEDNIISYDILLNKSINSIISMSLRYLIINDYDRYYTSNVFILNK